MRVLFAIAHFDKGGGQAVQCEQLLRRLAPIVNGELLALQAGDSSPPPSLGVQVVGRLSFPTGILRLREAIARRSSRYDLVHVLDPYYALPAARLAGPAHLVVRLGAHPVEDLARRYGRAARWALGVINPWLYRDATVVVNARHLADALPGTRVEVIPNGVDLSRFPETRDPSAARAALGLAIDRPWIGFAGKIIPRKNIEDLYWLAAAEPAVGLAIAGTDREPGYGDAYHRRVRESFRTVLPRVRTLGELPTDRVPRFLEALDAFVFPSRLEGMPNAVLEAMAAGVPVIASDTPAHREVVAPGTGILYGSRTELLAAMRALLDSPARASAMGRAGRRWVAERFGFDAAVRSYLRLYADVLRSPSAG